MIWYVEWTTKVHALKMYYCFYYYIHVVILHGNCISANIPGFPVLTKEEVKGTNCII